MVNQTYSSYLRMLISDLQTTLTLLGVGETLFCGRGTVGINTEMVDCDYYNYLCDTAVSRRIYDTILTPYSY